MSLRIAWTARVGDARHCLLVSRVQTRVHTYLHTPPCHLHPGVVSERSSRWPSWRCACRVQGLDSARGHKQDNTLETRTSKVTAREPDSPPSRGVEPHLNCVWTQTDELRCCVLGTRVHVTPQRDHNGVTCRQAFSAMSDFLFLPSQAWSQPL